MADREKVMEALENCIGVPKCCDCPWEECEGFVRHIDLPESLAKAAYELLKEQEETRLVRRYSRPNVYADLWLHCEKCGEKVNDNWHPKFCPGCGRRVKWG